MGSGAVDSSQWLSVKEETVFLHDGLIRVTDLAELPSEIGASEQGDTEQEVGDSISAKAPHRSSFTSLIHSRRCHRAFVDDSSKFPIVPAAQSSIRGPAASRSLGV